MCRFMVYKGLPALMADLVTRPSHSLIKQSIKSLEREEPLNGDGFGIGWYIPQISSKPGLYTSLTPAWANRNLERIAETIETPCLFAHVRAASVGGLIETNCHPFQYGNLLFMHNGTIAEFEKIKRKLRESLKDEYYNIILGTTDSEHAFALFLNSLKTAPDEASLKEIVEALSVCLKKIRDWSFEEEIDKISTCNFAVTNGKEIVVTRYVSDPGYKAESLYYTTGKRFECLEGECRMIDLKKESNAIIISSEPLTEYREDWTSLPENHFLTVNSDNKMDLFPIIF
ncbi:class II glutamine amidotransferase [Criblamydia sequanensis]|uniref:Glutamine amidotransferase type-2 domain-containing protein n=1 Tax=Candidatus Criblamydia sequanensis CRIB-18 TaxID=1437425 RepID=A0A090D038_9BACT|nr:class II glutamine amidotransferase [Criblamydia sequanensis]CDR34651.1 Conserved hypothetical protein [Criblamydia sequanensis CRIB-18]